MPEFIYQTLANFGYTHPLHPTLIHLPIGMVMRAVLFALADFIFPQSGLARTPRHCITLGLLTVPDCCDDAGRPAVGWSSKYIETRRFASDQSAWIYYRNSDLKHLVVKETAGLGATLRIWPDGTKLVIEIFKGHASIRKNANLIEIAVMSKLEPETGTTSADNVFFAPSWSFARFKPSGSAFITPAKVRECHQCHSIAFHLTGDLIFTPLP